MKILFVGHDANRTGAPISLLNLIEGVKVIQPHWDFSLLLLGGGELFDNYGSLIPTFKYTKPAKRRYQRLRQKIFKNKQEILDIKKHLNSLKPSVIYVNTIVPIRIIVPIAKDLDIPVFCHVREMDLVFKSFYPKSHDLKLFSNVNQFLIVNTQIKQNFLKKIGIKPNKIHIAPGPFNIDHYPIPNVKNESYTFIIALSGSSVFIKGLDIAIQSATYFKGDSAVEFHWFGGLDKNSFQKVDFEIDKLSIDKTFKIKGKVDRLYEELQKVNLFFLCSREDSFPRAAVEAALAELPILYFKGLTGVEDFLEDGVSGLGLEYLNYNEIKTKILFLKENPENARELGKNARLSALKYLKSQNTIKKVIDLIDEIEKKNNKYD
jgi:glycosyltransferase involved in cell wall biosynthesis